MNPFEVLTPTDTPDTQAAQLARARVWYDKSQQGQTNMRMKPDPAKWGLHCHAAGRLLAGSPEGEDSTEGVYNLWLPTLQLIMARLGESTPTDAQDQTMVAKPVFDPHSQISTRITWIMLPAKLQIFPGVIELLIALANKERPGLRAIPLGQLTNSHWWCVQGKAAGGVDGAIFCYTGFPGQFLLTEAILEDLRDPEHGSFLERKLEEVHRKLLQG